MYIYRHFTICLVSLPTFFVQELSKRKQEPVRVEEGRAMAERINATAYLECSAINNQGVAGRID